MLELIESAGPAGSTLQQFESAREKMGMGEAANGADDEATAHNPLRRAAARGWALLLVRICECLPLLCPSCGHPMRILAFLEDPPVVQKILLHIGEPIEAPEHAGDAWPEMDQAAGEPETWE